MTVGRLNALAIYVALAVSSSVAASSQNLVTNPNFNFTATDSSGEFVLDGTATTITSPWKFSANAGVVPSGSDLTWALASEPATSPGGGAWSNDSFTFGGSHYVLGAGNGWDWTAIHPTSHPSNAGTLSAPDITAAPGATNAGVLQNSSSISQEVTLVEGHTYTLIFEAEQYPGYLSSSNIAITVKVGTESVVFTGCGTSILPGSTWTTYTATFVDTNASGPEALTFSTSGAATHPYGEAELIDDVYLSAPEGGSTWGYLLMTGIVCFGIMTLGRRSPLAGRA